MRIVAQAFGLMLVAVWLPLAVLAQEIPNPSFEDWSGLNPDGWLSTNNPGISLINVTASSDAVDGVRSARLEVISFFSIPYVPALHSEDQATGGFPVTQRYEALNGFFKFVPQNGDTALASVLMYKKIDETHKTVIGAGEVEATLATDGWETFSVPIDYYTEEIPDGCWIHFQVYNETNIGGYALVDNISFGPAENGCCVGNRGNANSDPLDEANISDITFLINYLFGMPSGPPPACIEEANANSDPLEEANISDITFLVNYLFGIPSGPAPGPCP